MRYLALAVVLLAGCESPTPNAKGSRIVTNEAPTMYTVTDASHGVTCWMVYGGHGASGISCLRDATQ